MNHEVLNQPPPLTSYNPFSTDRALRDAVARESAGWACAELEEFGAITWGPEAMEWAVQAKLAEIRMAKDPRLEKFAAGIDNRNDPRERADACPEDVPEGEGRRLAERLVLALQASLLLRFSPPPIGDAFCASRLDGEGGRAFGTLANTIDLRFLA
jgi:hypothetical protein